MEILTASSLTEFTFSPNSTIEAEKMSKSDDNVEVHQNQLKSIDHQKEQKHGDIWGLFKEAQENILRLNKQRIIAMEELDRVKNERDSLLDRVKQLELGNMQRDKLSVNSELLLRIDSLVLDGVVGSAEASDLRRLVMDSRNTPDDFYEIISKNDDELLAELRHLSTKSNKNGFHVIHICTEMSPVVSVGSLASYITGLSCALQRKEILSRYACLHLHEVQGLREVDTEFYSYFNGQLHGNKIWTGFTYFSRASLDYLVKSGKRPDVLHIHNWQTSIVGPLFWDVFVNQGFESTRVLLTCQNFDSQCLEQPEKLALCGLDPSTLHRPDRLQDNNKAQLVNILKGGVVYSNKVIVLSAVQPKGRITSSLEHGLEPTLTIHKEKFVVAPWGLDKSTWDPSSDNFLPQSYSTDDMKGKSVCKTTLQQHLDLPEGAANIHVGCIYSDFSDDDLQHLKTLVWMASRRGVQFTFMQSSQTPRSRDLELFQEEVRDANVRFINEYDEELSHLIISGSDIMLCQSFDDPLLQIPLKAMKYGAAPVAIHHTDSNFRQYRDHDTESTKLSHYINNTFANISLSQAIDEIKNNPAQWIRMIRDAMTQDFSWDSECSDVHLSAYTEVKRL